MEKVTTKDRIISIFILFAVIGFAYLDEWNNVKTERSGLIDK